MTIQTLKDRLPDYAKDLKLNLGTLAAETALTEAQKAGAFIATALASREPQVIEAVAAEFAPRLTARELAAAKAAAALMGMNNVYYRFLHLVENPEYGSLPAKLRMNAIATHGIARETFELWCLAVSAVNGCGACLAAHEKVVREAGLTPEQVQAAVRIGAVVHAVAVVLEGEAALSKRALAQAA
ncbi:carboxymuconolactone decarboxylase family protein [Pelomicrobium sp. G1]|uniref:carboxymuconolactone decarboxylase family protein n=1 Tax=unclassified Pelomicrobium TaxID=2815318 RepID=UPI000A4CCD71|nr:MAG: alkyl hydroperoxide reductase AhpD [Burkholderiales bacterium]